MSNIILSYFSENGEVFYDSLAEGLRRLGNNVFQWNIRNYTNCKWGKSAKLISTEIKGKIEEFNPDVVFSFNNAYPQECLNYTKCKICVLDADNPEFFFNKKELVKNIDRFTFLGFKKCSKEFYETYFKKEVKNYIYFPAATFINAKEMEQDKNISFIANNFLYKDFYFGKKLDKIEYIDYSKHYYSSVKQNYFISFEEADARFKNQQDEILDIEKRESLFNYIRFNLIPGQGRIKHLSVLTDLGLVLYGSAHWNDEFILDADLTLCFDRTPVYSLEDNENVYNSTKVSINISHPQANTCFSWRVMDIMASNSCLLTEYSQDFIDLFGEYLSEDVLSAIIYKDRYDMRDKCIKLLNDDNLRKKCVQECQKAIELNGRWNLRFKKLGEELGVNFVSDDKATVIKERKIEEFYTPQNPNEPQELFHLKTKLLKNYKLTLKVEKQYSENEVCQYEREQNEQE